ncbi:ubiquitin-conjugating enzyme E2 F [Paragonimus westermani]|uniref:E2 NEDD8-conjugating enzyme n=1 Tax=Paragonimus westermani TaxID=34504 RepID=A0A5J4N901_9TREM|nr:ubiquitin-conjugating enzyme E2 F [Paragonimus westermani]
MISLADKIRQRKSGGGSNEPDAAQSASVRSAIIRDRLLLQELQELKTNLSSQCTIHHPDPNKLHEFTLTIKPKEGIWASGTFLFEVIVPEGYNHMPPLVHCSTRIWHPNIDEEGRVCLSLLRQSSLDSSGWAPTRRLLDVVWGIESLFTDLCDFNDALNTAAAEQFQRSPDEFYSTARNYIYEYAR